MGWRDFLAAGRVSLAFGGVVFVLSALISLAAWKVGSLWLLLGLLSGFIFAGPLLASGLYVISARLEDGQRLGLAQSLKHAVRLVSSFGVFALVLLIIILVWARSASMVHIFFPATDTDWKGLVLFLAVGSAIGSLFAAIVFAASAFSLPMLSDRDVDPITAVVTSVNAVLRNKVAMAVWIICIVILVCLSFLSGGLGLMVSIPVLGHATWHGYRETIDASAWPHRPDPSLTAEKRSD